jgi:hypothetical protein
MPGRSARRSNLLMCPPGDAVSVGLFGSAGAATQLIDRAFKLTFVLGVQLAKFSTLPHRLGEYDPGNKTLAMLDDLDPSEEAMVWVHELCHMRLHPPASSASASMDHGDIDEDLVVHHAAAAVCARFGVTGYRKKMLRCGVSRAEFPTALPREFESKCDQLAADVSAALVSPEVRPSW